MPTLHILTGGIGSGKSALSGVLVADTFSQADAIRHWLQERHPDVDWFRKDQAYKDAPHPRLKGQSPRDCLIRECDRLVTAKGYGILARMNIERILDANQRCRARAAIPYLQVIVDDVRRIEEIDEYHKFTIEHPDWRVIHWHIDGGVQDAQTTTARLEDLRTRANYIITRQVPLGMGSSSVPDE